MVHNGNITKWRFSNVSVNFIETGFKAETYNKYDRRFLTDKTSPDKFNVPVQYAFLCLLKPDGFNFLINIQNTNLFHEVNL